MNILTDDYKYKNPIPKPIEVFSSKAYRGYHVRGQALLFPYPSTSHDGRLTFYHFQLLALVKDGHKIIHAPTTRSKYYRFGTIFGKTRGEFDSLDVDNDQSFDSNDLQVKETPYLKECINEELPVIPVSLDIFTAYEQEISTGKIHDHCPDCIYPFIADYFGATGHVFEKDVRVWFANLHDTFCFELDYKGISKRDFIKLLEEIGDIASFVIYADKISKDDLRRLNELKSRINKTDDPLQQFCFSFVEDMIRDLRAKKILSACALCGDVFFFDVGKKYCSALSDGKDCGKKARNKAFYEKHQEKIKPKARRIMTELRDFYKKKGVKKSSLLKQRIKKGAQ